MHSILVIRLSSMGDVILATPLVRQLRATYPQAIIDVAVAERFADVWRNNPRVTNVFAVPTSVPTQTYDLVVDLQANARSRSLIPSQSRTIMRINKHRIEKLSLVYLKRRPAVVTPIVDRYRNAVASLPLLIDSDGPEVWVSKDPREDTRAILGTVTKAGADLQGPLALQGERVAIAPGAHHFTKRWPAERFAALCKGLADEGATPVLVGGPADVELCNAIAQAAGSSVDNQAGSMSVQDTARILDTCVLIVTNDTGVMHLASARRLPVVAIFGSTVPELGFAPYGVPHTIVEHPIACRPCTHIGRSSCPRGHFLCMVGVTVDEVLHATLDLFRRHGN